MITLYTWSTPNGRKISIALEEMGLPYEVRSVNIGKDEQFAPEFLAISPNNKIPAITDGDLSMMEANAILVYLARKTGRFLPPEGENLYWQALEWLTWQAASFGPMLGQAHHFLKFNPGKAPYAEERYHAETKRLYGVLDTRLQGRDCILGDLSIVDFATWPWASRFEWHGIDLNDYPAVRDWYVRLAGRPAFKKGYQVPNDAGPVPMPG